MTKTKILWKWGLKFNFYENSGKRDRVVVKHVGQKELANLKKGGQKPEPAYTGPNREYPWSCKTPSKSKHWQCNPE